MKKFQLHCETPDGLKLWHCWAKDKEQAKHGLQELKPEWKVWLVIEITGIMIGG